MEPINVASLKKDTGVTDDQLKQKCAAKHLRQIAPLVGNYTKFASCLGLPPGVLAGIRVNPLLNFQQQTEEVFLWWSKNIQNATYLSFVQVCIELSEGDIAVKMCELCAAGSKADVPPSSNVPRSDETHPDPASPSKPSGKSPQDNEESEVQQLFCGIAGHGKLNQDNATSVPARAQSGSARRHLLWDVKQIPELKVHFLNSSFLKSKNWKCGCDQLTVNNVLDWARVWKSGGMKYPKIYDGVATNKDAHIRILFASSVTSWSMVGTEAYLVTDVTKPTMVLNLYGMTKAQQRSMVIHEFGHALGLDHEHQRSDFWDVLEKKDDDGQYQFIIGKKRMKSGDAGNCKPASDAVFRAKLETPSGTEKTSYDSESVMHYWFDKNWLQPEYRSLQNIRMDQSLSLCEKKVLEGVHARDYCTHGQQAEDPSDLDYETLNKAYMGSLQLAEGTGAPPTLPEATSPSAQTSGTVAQRNPPMTTSPASTSSVTVPLSPDVTFTTNHESEVFAVLKDARARWYFIGKGIGCNVADLNEIRRDNHGDLMCLHQMLHRRIQRGGLTRSMLYSSLQGEMVQNDHAAQGINALVFNW